MAFACLARLLRRDSRKISAELLNGLAKRDLADITAGAESLPGAWRVEAGEGDAGRAWLRPLGDRTVPAFAFARGDGFITVRMAHAEQSNSASSMVFGVFTSVVAALDAIHNDVLLAYELR
jgi:hypothetical protein